MGEKSIHKYHCSKQFVIIVKCSDSEKYVGRDYLKKHGFEYTGRLNKANRFQSELQAHKAAKWLGIDDRCKVAEVTVEMKVEV